MEGDKKFMGDMMALWDYHGACMELVNLKNSLATTEAGIKRQKLHGFLSDMQKTMNALQGVLAAKSTELAECNEMFIKIEKRFDLETAEIDIMRNDDASISDEVAESTRAFELLSTDIKLLKSRMMDVLSTLTKVHVKLKEVLSSGARAKKEYDVVVEECIKERQGLEGKISEAKNAIREREKKIDAALLQKFKRIQKMHHDPIVRIEDNKCGGCKMSLPTSIIRKARASQEIIECETCGRLLYCKEQSE